MEARIRSNLFEIENARNLTKDELVATFVPTKAFPRLLNSKNHIILGSRGSGKTVLAKMLSHDHLSKLDDVRARKVIEDKSLIGVYVPMRLEWVGGLKNKLWQNESEKEEFFKWRLNIATCMALLETLNSCLLTYVQDEGERALRERKIVGQLSRDWLNEEKKIFNIKELKWLLEDVEYKKQQSSVKFFINNNSNIVDSVGLSFDMELFTPLRRGIDIINRFLEFPETTKWALCLDEAEFLEQIHHRMLNSFMRSCSGQIAFKITTMPYFHHTLETNTVAPLNVGHDFEYVYIDQDPISSVAEDDSGYDFAANLFSRRAELSGSKYKGIKLNDFLGESVLLDYKESDWESEDSELFPLLTKHCTGKTIDRAKRLIGGPGFKDQIGRKIHGALLLKEAVSVRKGHAQLDVYSGAKMAIRCSDGNPRRLIRIFNSLLLEAKWNKSTREGRKAVKQLTKKDQTRILSSFSASTLNRIQSEPKCGYALYRLVNLIGDFMSTQLHGGKISTDLVSSIYVDEKCSEEIWTAIKYGVALGLLYPNINANYPDQMPENEAVFHLAYVIAPFFKLMPRRGSSRSLINILKAEGSTPKYKKMCGAFKVEQMSLFSGEE